jgi:predicted DsbA family dithiol-disulfide isomerase
VWEKTRLSTFTNADLLIKVAELVEGPHRVIDLSLNIGKAFFIDAIDIGNLDILMEIVEAQGTTARQSTSK